MIQTIKLCQIGMKQMASDGMLMVLLLAPLLVGVFFQFAIPLLNHLLEENIAFSIVSWYGLFDGMLVCLTPMFVAIVSAFLLLEERDEEIVAYYQITPVADYAYLLARIGLPMLFAGLMTIIVAVLFQLTTLSMMTILLSTILSCFSGIFLAMMVVSLAGNRVEGLAFSKLMGISFLGLFMVWLLPEAYAYYTAILPSFWIGKMMMNGADMFHFLAGLLVCGGWILLFTNIFLKKISS